MIVDVPVQVRIPRTKLQRVLRCPACREWIEVSGAAHGGTASVASNASRTSGLLCPRLANPSPECMSRWARPEASYRYEPRADTYSRSNPRIASR